MTEIVYVFTNPAMPDYVKIGKTSKNNVRQRLKELSNPTGVPMPFECLYAAEVADATKVEEAFHDAFDCDRPNKKREFFTTDPKRIITLLKRIAITDVTPATKEMLDQITPTEDKVAQPDRIRMKELKTKSWEEVVMKIGGKNKELKENLLAIPFTKDNVNKLRSIIENVPKPKSHTSLTVKLATLLALLEQL